MLQNVRGEDVAEYFARLIIRDEVDRKTWPTRYEAFLRGCDLSRKGDKECQ